MPFKNFVHLHVHTEYSLLDGACRLGPLIHRARELRLPALAITDHGAMYGAIEFYHACLKHGIKPILGLETYVAPTSRFTKHSAHGGKDASHHLVLLARDWEGYRNLVALSSIGFLQGFYYRPRIDLEVLAKHARGLIGLSACLHGEIPLLIQNGELPQARQRADEYRQIFGPGNFYLELMDHGLPAQGPVNRGLVDLSRALEIPLVATNDVHYLRREDALAHEVLLCLQTGTTLEDERHLRFPTQEFYLKSGEEMEALFRELPEAGLNTLEIANHCNLEIPVGAVKLPRYPVPEDERSRLPGSPPAGSQEELDAYLARLCRAALSSRYPEGGEAVEQRLAKELAVIRDAGYAGYFLIVWDFIGYARAQGIPVGPGRGSVAGSLVAYLLGITDIDPLRYQLIFERFLNPARVSPPDIDVDFSDKGRDEVIRYVTRKYGQENVAQIITFGTLAAKAAVRDVGRVMGYPYDEVDRLAKLIPQELDITLDKARERTPELQEQYEANERVRALLDTARALEGQVRHASTHAAGVVIAREPLLEIVPLCQAKASRSGEGGGDAGGGDGTLTTQYPMESLERLGLLKMDFLGLRTLSIIADTLEEISWRQGERLRLESLACDDAATFRLLGEGHTTGVFQLESAGMRDLLKRLKPRSLEEICALIALYRPGPMAIIDDYIARKQGRLPIRYIHPDLERILAETYGTIVYQEQVMQIAVTLGGFSFAQADLLRRAMGKKNPELIEQQRDNFMRGALARGLDAGQTEAIFDQMARFGEYGFNKSHSLAYAVVAYRTAYLKANYPVEYMASMLSNEMGNSDKVALCVAECRRLGLAVRPPDVNASREKFSVDGNGVRFGLGAVRNVGLGAAQAIRQEREARGLYAGFADFCSRQDLRTVNARVIESLIKSGAFDGQGESRARLLEALPRFLALAQRRQEERERGQESLFGELGANALELGPVPPEAETVRLANEKEALGFYLSGHPLAAQQELLQTFDTVTTAGLAGREEGTAAVVGGMVVGVRRSLTKRKEPMVRFTLEDMEGLVEVIVWPDLLGRHGRYIVKDAMLFVQGRVDAGGDEVKLVAGDIIPLEEAYARLSQRLHVMVAATAGAELLGALKDMLARHPGAVRVMLHVQTEHRGEVTELLPERYAVTVSAELMAQLRELLGPERVRVAGKINGNGQNHNGGKGAQD